MQTFELELQPNHQNVLFLASIPCDISQQTLLRAEISQGICVSRNLLLYNGL